MIPAMHDSTEFLKYYLRIKARTRALFPLIPPEKIEWINRLLQRVDVGGIAVDVGGIEVGVGATTVGCTLITTGAMVAVASAPPPTMPLPAVD